MLNFLSDILNVLSDILDLLSDNLNVKMKVNKAGSWFNIRYLKFAIQYLKFKNESQQSRELIQYPICLHSVINFLHPQALTYKSPYNQYWLKIYLFEDFCKECNIFHNKITVFLVVFNLIYSNAPLLSQNKTALKAVWILGKRTNY